MVASTPTILFVEDCESDFELACPGLEPLPVAARPVGSGRDLEQLLKEAASPIDLFIVDLNLPDTSGLTVAQQLRARPHTAQTPIVFFSSSTNPNDAESALRIGADDFHVKPVVPVEFLRVVEQIVSRWLPHLQ